MLPAPQTASLPHGRLTWRESGRRNAPALVLLHGIGSSSAGWSEQFGPLGEALRVIAWNAPGYRDSDALPGDAPHVDAYAGVLAALLDHLEVESTWIASNSWGALPALAFACLHPRRSRGLLLGSPSAGYGTLPRQEQRARAEERAARIRTLGPAHMRAEDAPRLVAPGTREHLLEQLRSSGDELTVEGYAQAARMLYATDGLAMIARLEQPILVLSGTADIITPPEANAKRLATAASNARLEMLTGIGHLPHLEAPARFNAALLAFVRQHSCE
jgi:pimeloyl-ACP methyl ester carboxylesterase